ncbi:MAG: RraA family protein [Thaumarchaeota archaeon]|nr:RraA family protein [Candidatus Calditenuaceae archaeon]MDW8186699.1 RraA family protein [Nitrososphaerota archaeon]
MGDYNPVVVKEVSRPSRDVVDAFKELSTPNISDSLERTRISGVIEGIRPMVQGVRIAGPAITVRYVPLSPAEQGTKEDIGDYLFDLAQPGDVIVIDNGGVTSYTCWGDILTFTAMKLGIAGTVIDGVFRDYDNILRFRYPIFARGTIPRTGKDRLQIDGINVAVQAGGVLIMPGDIIVGDDTGLLRVPKERASEVLRDAKEIEEAERMIIESVRSGKTLREARQQYRYFQLQRSK